MQTEEKNEWQVVSGREMAEYAMQAGPWFPLLARETPAGRGLWPQGFFGIEAGSRLERSASSRGADRRARAR
jgi:purine nucleoside permease